MDELTPDEKQLIGFALACYLEDLDKKISKESRNRNMSMAVEQRNKIERITYTKIIPDSWCGPKPKHWSE